MSTMQHAFWPRAYWSTMNYFKLLKYVNKIWCLSKPKLEDNLKPLTPDPSPGKWMKFGQVRLEKGGSFDLKFERVLPWRI